MRWRCSFLLTALALGIAAGCGSGGGGGIGVSDDPGPVHIHGLGVNPADGALFLATHSGLFRVAPEGGAAERVGELLQDTMGFTVVGENWFLGSGHPDLRQKEADDLPPHLGLIESTDGGETWERISLLGEADFHALRAVGNRVLGFDATNARLLVSGDKGRSWREAPIPEPLVDVVMNPANGRELVASGEKRLFRSVRDGGWRPIDKAAGLLSWPARDVLFLVHGDGELLRSPDGGASWVRIGNVGGEPAAIHATTEGDVYVALHDATILRSQDGGASFGVHSSPPSGS